MTAWREYQSHKLVRAACITARCGYELWIRGESGDAEKVVVDPAMFSRYKPRPGDYLVEYASGYRSISPKAVFEAGYSDSEGMISIDKTRFGELSEALRRAIELTEQVQRNRSESGPYSVAATKPG